MKYKYRKNQIFGKRLRVPRYIRDKIYTCTLSFDEFVRFELEDKIPISCIKPSDREIVEKFGIEKVKTLDWELLSPQNSFLSIKDFTDINTIAREKLMSIDESVENLNEELYERVRDIIPPNNYSSSMKKIYNDRLFSSNEFNNNTNSNELNNFNKGITT